MARPFGHPRAGDSRSYTTLASPALAGNVVANTGSVSTVTAWSAQYLPTTGKFYAECLVIASANANSADIGWRKDTNDDLVLRAYGGTYIRTVGGSQTSGAPALTFTPPFRAKFAIDMDAGKGWIGLVGTGWDTTGGASPDPATGVSPFQSWTTPLASTWRFVCGVRAGSAGVDYGAAAVAFFDPRGWVDTPPAGYRGIPAA